MVFALLDDRKALPYGQVLPICPVGKSACVNRIKMLERQMSGRAGCLLLRNRVLAHQSVSRREVGWCHPTSPVRYGQAVWRGRWVTSMVTVEPRGIGVPPTGDCPCTTGGSQSKPLTTVWTTKPAAWSVAAALLRDQPTTPGTTS